MSLFGDKQFALIGGQTAGFLCGQEMSGNLKNLVPSLEMVRIFMKKSGKFDKTMKFLPLCHWHNSNHIRDFAWDKKDSIIADHSWFTHRNMWSYLQVARGSQCFELETLLERCKRTSFRKKVRNLVVEGCGNWQHCIQQRLIWHQIQSTTYAGQSKGTLVLAHCDVAIQRHWFLLLLGISSFCFARSSQWCTTRFIAPGLVTPVKRT